MPPELEHAAAERRHPSRLAHRQTRQGRRPGLGLQTAMQPVRLLHRPQRLHVHRRRLAARRPMLEAPSRILLHRRVPGLERPQAGVVMQVEGRLHPASLPAHDAARATVMEQPAQPIPLGRMAVMHRIRLRVVQLVLGRHPLVPSDRWTARTASATAAQTGAWAAQASAIPVSSKAAPTTEPLGRVPARRAGTGLYRRKLRRRSRAKRRVSALRVTIPHARPGQASKTRQGSKQAPS